MNNPIESVLKEFLRSEHQRVLMIEGFWGLGKTFYWKNFIAKNGEIASEPQYCYVSLFGVGSLSAVKTLITASGENQSATKDHSESVQDLTRRLVTRFNSSTLGRMLTGLKVPYLNLETLIGQIGELYLENYLICFDDLERRDAAFTMEQFLGLVSFLKENRKCRVVLICNRDAIDERGKAALDLYSEKVLDRIVHYAPSPEENFALVFANDSHPHIQRLFARLQLSNIRIMQLVKWALEYFLPTIKTLRREVAAEFEEQVTKLVCIHYGFPSLLSVDALNTQSWAKTIWDTGERTEKQKKAGALIQALDFNRQEYDPWIIDYLKRGFCDIKPLDAALAEVTKDTAKARARERCRAVFELLYFNFRASAQEIADAAVEVLISENGALTLSDADELIDLVKQTDPKRDCTPHLVRICSNIVPTASLETLDKIAILAGVGALSATVEGRRKALMADVTLDSLVSALASTTGWDPADFIKLANFRAAEIAVWMEASTDDCLLSNLANLLQRARRDRSPSTLDVVKQFEEALKIVSSRSELNARRVEKYIYKPFEEAKQLLMR